MTSEQEGKTLTPDEIGRAVELLIEIERTDDQPLYRKVRRAIAVRRTKRRRAIFVRACAAVLLPLAVLAGVRLATGGECDRADVVSIMAPGGSVVAMTGEHAGERIPGGETLVVVEDGGTLRLVDESAAAPQLVLATYHTLNVPRANRYDMELPDGSHVWLNSDSRISFPKAFTGPHRRIYVEGEVYFEVVRDEGRPFVVETRGMKTTVLGTSFNVYSYHDEPFSHTTLISGSVRVDCGGRQEILQPGRQAVFDAATGSISVREVDTWQALSWRHGIIDMDKRTLEEVAATLARLYDVRFEFRDAAAAQIRYRGNITRSDDIDDVLHSLSAVSPVEFRRHGGAIEVGMK